MPHSCLCLRALPCRQADASTLTTQGVVAPTTFTAVGTSTEEEEGSSAMPLTLHVTQQQQQQHVLPHPLPQPQPHPQSPLRAQERAPSREDSPMISSPPQRRHVLHTQEASPVLPTVVPTIHVHIHHSPAASPAASSPSYAGSLTPPPPDHHYYPHHPHSSGQASPSPEPSPQPTLAAPPARSIRGSAAAGAGMRPGAAGAQGSSAALAIGPRHINVLPLVPEATLQPPVELVVVEDPSPSPCPQAGQHCYANRASLEPGEGGPGWVQSEGQIAPANQGAPQRRQWQLPPPGTPLLAPLLGGQYEVRVGCDLWYGLENR